MKLSECSIGVVVKSVYNDDNKKVGHVMGFTLNDDNQVVVLVKWADGSKQKISAYNIELLKDYEKGK